MPRYEFVEGKSSKFWEIEMEGTSFTTTYGRIGTEGQSSMKEYDSEEKAEREYEKLVAEKVKKGYVLVDGNGAAPRKPAPKPEKPAPAKKAAKAAVFEDEGDDEDDDEEKTPVKPVAKAAASKPAKPAGETKKTEGARYFEFVDGKSSKFWEIALSGTYFTTRYGRIGTDGQESMKEYDSEEKAERECEKLIAEKVKKGYLEK
jgi:predicted DNA-binding WGR domain protein